MIPAAIDPRAFLGAGSLSYSEITTLSGCENKWALTYGQPDRERTPAGPAAALGTEIHSLLGHWWLTGELADTEDPTARWVMDRYAAFYGADRANGHVRMIEVEKPFALQLPDGSYLFGYIDGLAEVRGMTAPGIGSLDGLWAVEFKTTGAIDNLLHLEHSIQGPTYTLALLVEGVPVRGVMLDVLSTTGSDKTETKADAYKRFRASGLSTAAAKAASADVTQRLLLEPAPLHESFERRWLAYDEAALQATVQSIASAVSVRSDLTTGRRTPMRNLGFFCRNCPVVAPCLGLEVTVLPESS